MPSRSEPALLPPRRPAVTTPRALLLLTLILPMDRCPGMDPDNTPFIHMISTASASVWQADPPPLPDDDDWSRGAFVRVAELLGPGADIADRRAAARWMSDRLADPAIAEDPDRAWEAWGEWVLLTEPVFYQRLARAHARRAEAIARDREEITRRLTERREALVAVYRRLYARLPSEEKSPLLVEMIGTGIPALQGAACQLAMRTLQNAGTVDPVVTDAAAGLIDAPDPVVRGAATQLVEQLDPGALGSVAIDRLESESDPGVAGALMRSLATAGGAPETTGLDPEAARARTGSLARAVVRWLALPSADGGPEEAVIPEAPRAAFDAAVSLLLQRTDPARSGAPGAIDRRSEVMNEAADRLVAALPVRITPESVALLARLRRFEAVVGLLQSPVPAVARAAGEGLASEPRFVDPIVRAAARRTELFEPAMASLMAHRPTAEAFATALSLPAGDPGHQRALLVAMCRRLPPDQLLLAMRGTEDPDLIESCLAPLLIPRSADQNGSGGEAPDAAPGAVPLPPAIELALSARLARSRLARGESLGVLDVISAMSERHPELLAAGEEVPEGTPETTALIAAGIEAAVALNRLDRGAELLVARPSQVDAWLAGMERMADAQTLAAAAGRLLALETEHGAITLSGDERARLTRQRDGQRERDEEPVAGDPDSDDPDPVADPQPGPEPEDGPARESRRR
ncbi:MAG: hypothetical protein ACTS3F_01910 [Phycisphaerales bacterium]